MTGLASNLVNSPLTIIVRFMALFTFCGVVMDHGVPVIMFEPC
jgi:hypothetical protein